MNPDLNPHSKPISAKLNDFTDNDPEFKQELMGLMIHNLRELQKAVSQLISRSQFPYFEKIVHKTKSVLVILDDAELNKIIDDLKYTVKHSADLLLCEKIKQFNHVTENIIKILEDEGSIQQAS